MNFIKFPFGLFIKPVYDRHLSYTSLCQQERVRVEMNYDQKELEKFSSLAAQWWDPLGPIKTLHQINPVRLEYIISKVNLENKNLLDIGCGGGLLTEALAKAKANVTGIDMSSPLIETAQLHLHESKLKIHYEVASSSEYAITHQAKFDIITCLELLEHVPDPLSLIADCYQLLKPGGVIFFSTINRNLKAYCLAILGAEYFLKWLPIKTHNYDKFIKPSELANWCREKSLLPVEIKGMVYSPFSQHFKLSNDISVNYLLYAKRK